MQTNKSAKTQTPFCLQIACMRLIFSNWSCTQDKRSNLFSIKTIIDIKGSSKKVVICKTFAIKHRPPPLTAVLATVLFTPLFYFEFESYRYEMDFTLISVKNITLSPLIIGSKLTYAGCSGRWLPYSTLFRVTSTNYMHTI